MTTGWLIVNIVMVVVATVLVAGPAVLVPLLLDRKYRVDASAVEESVMASVHAVSATAAAPAFPAV